ncbi:uncharacterized protein (TIGR04222 family) [Streptomyces sp. TLI_235]|nr:TIGR04222 domain-containing membrane protein [Streptomyces sp. TLI_235]PBC77340.1 uncharacterized protein (TIGR04222 family) [Streptomyces sp. TLI_235]
MWSTEFTVALVLVLATGAAVSVTNARLRRVPHPRGLSGRGLELLETAFLAGGPTRVAVTALIRMQQEGRVIVSRSGTVTVTDPQPRDAVEAALIEAAGPGRQQDAHVLRLAVARSAAVQEIGDRLAERGLMRRPDRHRALVRARIVFGLALLATVALGVFAMVDWAGRSFEDRYTGAPPVLPFAILLIVGVIFLVATRPDKGRVTPAGRRQLSMMKEGGAWRPWDVAAPAAALAVLGALALDGTEILDEETRAALMARQLAATYALNSASGSTAVWCGSSSDGGSSSSCGSSSCGSSSGSCGSSGGSCSSGSSCGGGSSCGSSCGGGGCGGS